MIEIEQGLGETVLVAKLSGIMRARDYIEAIPEIKKRVAEIDPKHLLLDWKDLEGWDDEAESLRFVARIELRSKLERLAVLADEAWDRDVKRLQEVTKLPTRRFPPSERQSALDWLDSVASLH